MGVAGVGAFLRRHGTVVLDSCVFVYQLEENLKYLPLTDFIFSWLQRPESSAIASTIAMTELLVQPYRDQDASRVDRCFGLLSRFPNLTWTPPSMEIADVAASLRAEHRLKTPDAIMAATAIVSGAKALITNDSSFGRVESIETLLLDAHL